MGYPHELTPYHMQTNNDLEKEHKDDANWKTVSEFQVDCNPKPKDVCLHFPELIKQKLRIHSKPMIKRCNEYVLVRNKESKLQRYILWMYFMFKICQRLLLFR